MEINFGSNRVGGLGVGYGMTDAAESKASSGLGATRNVDIRSADLDALRRSEPVADIPDDALVRDDALGQLVHAAFSLPPPPMPVFEGHGG